AVCQQLDDGEVRSAQSDGSAQAARQWRQAACLPAGRDGSLLQGGEGIAQRGRRDQCELQESAGVADRVLEQWIPVVPGRGSWLRQLHGASLAELIAPITCRRKRKTRSESSGFLAGSSWLLRFCRRTKIKRWKLDLRHVDPDLAQI